MLKTRNKIFFHLFILTTNTILIFLIYSKFYNFLLKQEVDQAVDLTLKQYKLFFSMIEKKYHDNKVPINGYVQLNTSLYLGSRESVQINSLKISTKNTENKKIEENDALIPFFHLMEHKKSVLYSKSYINKDLITEPMIDLSYGFISDNKNFVTFSISIFLEDFFNNRPAA